MRRLGASADWSRERFTMDEGLSAAVLETFVRLYGDGLIYRGKRLVNWDPKLGTAVSDLEVENDEIDGKLWQIRYPFADGSGSGLGPDGVTRLRKWNVVDALPVRWTGPSFASDATGAAVEELEIAHHGFRAS